MNSFQSSENSNIVSQSNNGKLSRDELKSFFYLLKGKTDTELRLLPNGKVLELADIRSINEQIEAKLRNHEIVANIASINFILSNKKIKDYSSWNEFERENWDYINETVKCFNISWDILIKLPHYEYPQRHSIKLRIGDAIPPKDIFQLFFTSDDISELLEVGASGVCKVDFLNNIIANELLNIVNHWHESLKDTPALKPTQLFFKKQGRSISEIIRMTTPIVLLLIYYVYSDNIFYLLHISNELSAKNFQTVLIILITIYIIGSYIGKNIEYFIDRSIDNFERYPKFNITKGDKNAVSKIQNINDNLSKQIISKIFWTFFTVLISFCLKYLLSYIL